MNRFCFSIFLALVTFLSFNLYAAPFDCRQQYCLAIVDAGSTGSRFHIYTYDLDEHNSPIHIAEQWSKKIKPGFASLENTQAAVDSYLNNLVIDAPQASLPVYFYATAGMRLLPQPKQTEMFTYLNNWFNHQSQWQ